MEAKSGLCFALISGHQKVLSTLMVFILLSSFIIADDELSGCSICRGRLGKDGMEELVMEGGRNVVAGQRSRSSRASDQADG